MAKLPDQLTVAVDADKATAKMAKLADEFREIASALAGLASEFREVALVKECAEKLEKCQQLLIRLHRDGELSEGQVAAATGLDRATIRAMVAER